MPVIPQIRPQNIKLSKIILNGHYTKLKFLEKHGKIKDIELQPRIPLLVNGKSIGFYVGDFRYYDKEKQRLILEDVKSPITKTPIYKLKKKILETYQPPIEIVEIF
mgnify:CR=1 FL=1